MNFMSSLFSVILAAWIAFCSYLYTCVYWQLCDQAPLAAVQTDIDSPEDTSTPEKTSVPNPREEKNPEQAETTPPPSARFWTEDKLAKIKSKQVIYFGYNQVNWENLDEASLAYFDLLEQYLKDYPQTKVTLRGFADNVGSETRNRELSGQRAEQVKNHLVSKGIPAGQISTEAMGSQNPIADNETEAGRQKNRRVEITIQS
ncbi:MAG: OmpA family protein [Bacteroidia bacterium]|nr:OmpA family protein [Bacteroidia bacterium]